MAARIAFGGRARSPCGGFPTSAGVDSRRVHVDRIHGGASHVRSLQASTLQVRSILGALLMSVLRQDGRLHSWLAAVPKSTAAHGSRVAVLSSLHEATVVDAARPGKPTTRNWQSRHHVPQ